MNSTKRLAFFNVRTISICLQSFLYYIILVTFTEAQDSIVQTKLGTIRGKLKYVPQYNISIRQFLKIPYAKPPIGDKRFRKPETYGCWKGELDGRNFGPICPQDDLNVNMSEDCLFLNVYAPVNSSVLKSVMVFIHGGSYLRGGSNFYDASGLCAGGDVVVVTINYRLAFLGFMTTSDSSAFGNYGLWDQRMAIQWVHENIASFGGNRNIVTIFGESAGSFSVGFHTIYPGNLGLFQRAIMQSGTPFSLIALGSNTKYWTYKIGEVLGCGNENSGNSRQFVNCLQKKSLYDILNATAITGAKYFQFKDYLMVTLGPVVDNDFIAGDPRQLAKKYLSPQSLFLQSLDVMAGTVHNEGSLVLSPLNMYQDTFHFNLSAGIPKNLTCGPYVHALVSQWFSNVDEIAAKICQEYFSPGLSRENASKIATHMFADEHFVTPTVTYLNTHAMTADNRSTYQYVMNRYQGRFSYKFPFPKWFDGPGHGADPRYLFQLASETRNDSTSTVDYDLSFKMVTYWSNFAKTGNPNQPKNVIDLWPEYTTDGGEYIILDTNITQDSRLLSDRILFWNETIPNLANETTTFAPVSTTTAGSGSRQGQNNDLYLIHICLLITMFLWKTPSCNKSNAFL